MYFTLVRRRKLRHEQTINMYGHGCTITLLHNKPWKLAENIVKAFQYF